MQIDAIVTDKSGNHIHGLKAENFQVFEDRTTQKITGVDFCDIHQSETDATANPVSIDMDNPADPDSLRAIGASHRLIVLFFDRTTMEPEDTLRAVNSARDFVKNQMTSADIVTVATYGTQLVVNSNFTNDRSTLDQTLSDMISGKGHRTPGKKKPRSTTASTIEVASQLSTAAFPPPKRWSSCWRKFLATKSVIPIFQTDFDSAGWIIQIAWALLTQ